MPFLDHDLPLQTETLTFTEKIIRHLRNTFTKGLFVVIPLGITIFILKFLFNFVDGILGPHLATAYSYITHHPGYIPGLGMLSGALVIYVAGLAAGNIMGKLHDVRSLQRPSCRTRSPWHPSPPFNQGSNSSAG